jgi:hypothetical protein
MVGEGEGRKWGRGYLPWFRIYLIQSSSDSGPLKPAHNVQGESKGQLKNSKWGGFNCVFYCVFYCK